MGNPHPSKSKPFKIGRKHTGQLGLRAIGRLASKNAKAKEFTDSKWFRYHQAVKAYWRNELDSFPSKPVFH